MGRYAITYNDMKAVNAEIFKWVFCQFGEKSIDLEFARHLERQLVKRIISLPPGRGTWAKAIMRRFENGSRKTAEVSARVSSLTPPTPPS